VIGSGAAPEALGAPAARLRDTIGRTSLGLLNAVQEVTLSGDENVLLVVDQFEELFRFERECRHQDGGAEASLFVESLLEAADAYAAHRRGHHDALGLPRATSKVASNNTRQRLQQSVNGAVASA
jgi:hypothetical protein